MDILEFIEKKKDFLKYLKDKQKSEHTQKSYSLDLDQITKFWQNQDKSKDLEQIISIYLNIYDKNISKSSIARKISCINSFKKYLLSLDIKLNINPKRPIIKVKEPITIDPQDISIILDLIDINKFPTKSPYRDKAIIELLYATGILCSEITQIEIEHIDFNSKTIIIRSKNKKERTVIFGSKAYLYINLYISKERAKIKDKKEKLFLNNKNKPLGIRSIQKICQMFRAYLGNNKILTPNILRNSFATHMLERGLNIEQMQKLLGHKTRVSTERYIKKNKTN